ncbi:MAG TPA: pyridoxamine 5'-phosphate oxidase family protein [Burkholderiaceae bacterium]|nr:pyridoxamine 5'-phosphate oxidase family protein [Burkholderiaceae bacterium]HPH13931.1 pyridoxamine 5'-phosphate oxidase family protein [Burkholderiaceae bacterium]
MKSRFEYASDIAFTPAVKSIQTRKGSRHAYSRMEEGGSWETRISADLASFIAEQTSVFLATVNAQGQPYIQHRGGPAGFLQVIDDRTLGFVDYAGNRQYISSGNLAESPKAHLFLMDYSRRQRVKIWGNARVVEGDAALIQQLMPPEYKARAEHAIIFDVLAWDANCPQHIPMRLDALDVETELSSRDARIRALEAEVATLRGSGD